MARKQKNRIVKQPPLYGDFKPTGIAARYLPEIELTLDEYEALRLSDYEGMSQEEASLEMSISRPTFTRLIEKARRKIVDFIINGKKLKIIGGNIHFRNNIFKCFDCEQMFVLEIDKTVSKCPACNSNNITNLAGGFGHGKCCVEHEE